MASLVNVDSPFSSLYRGSCVSFFGGSTHERCDALTSQELLIRRATCEGGQQSQYRRTQYFRAPSLRLQLLLTGNGVADRSGRDGGNILRTVDKTRYAVNGDVCGCTDIQTERRFRDSRRFNPVKKGKKGKKEKTTLMKS